MDETPRREAARAYGLVLRDVDPDAAPSSTPFDPSIRFYLTLQHYFPNQIKKKNLYIHRAMYIYNIICGTVELIKNLMHQGKE